MTYFKSTLVGIVTALIAVGILVLAMLQLWVSEGSVTTYISISSWQVLVTAFVGFAAGFWWTIRRLRTRRA